MKKGELLTLKMLLLVRQVAYRLPNSLQVQNRLYLTSKIEIDKVIDSFTNPILFDQDENGNFKKDFEGNLIRNFEVV